MLLNDEEILRARYGRLPDCVSAFVMLEDRQLAKAQLKKVVEWLDEYCDEHPMPAYPVGKDFVLRRDCPMCWQSLLEEIE